MKRPVSAEELAAALIASGFIKRYSNYALQAHPRTMARESEQEVAAGWAADIFAALPADGLTSTDQLRAEREGKPIPFPSQPPDAGEGLHPFKDEWSFQRSMSKPYPGNPVAGQPIGPRQPCFTCTVPFAEHAQPPAAQEAER